MDVRTPSPDASIVDIAGAVTADSEADLMAAYGDASGADTRFIVLNFSGLEYMNSGGIGLLVTLLVRANRQRQRLLAFGLSDHYREIFEITRLADFLAINPDEDSAVRGAEGSRDA